MAQAWQNRIVRYSDEAPDQLLANPANWRTHSGWQAEALRGILGDVGIVQNVIANVRSGFLIDGHLRVMEAMRSGQPTIPVTWVDLSPAEEALVLATLDPLSALAGTDAAKLDELLREISTDSPAVQALLDSLAVEAGIVPGLDAPGAGGDEFDTTPVEGPTRTAVGDLWLLGKHRLLVDDCTITENVVRLMDGKRADAVVTDPPYGIDASKMTLGIGKRNFHRGDWDSKRPDVRWLLEAAPLVAIWGGNYFAHNLPITNDWLCWHKKNDGLSFGEFELAWTNFGGGMRHLSHHWAGEEKSHPTQKPLAVIEWAISQVPASVVFDPFLGSGTTLIAAQRTGRTCYGMEIEPRYADVILRRWEAETGQQAQKAEAT